MKHKTAPIAESANPQTWDLIRLSKSKTLVDICPNTLRAYHDQGLRFYRMGKAIFISKMELAAFIRNKASNTCGQQVGQKKNRPALLHAC